MRKLVLLALGLFFQLLITPSVFPNLQCYACVNQTDSFLPLTIQNGGPYSLQPVYLRLQAEQSTNVTLWESIPQNFSDHVATIRVNVLAIFASSNAMKTDLWRDAVGNLWLTVAYALKAGDYISTLTWVARKTIVENTTIPETIRFPDSYPEEIEPFLKAGEKIPAEDSAFKQIAQSLSNQNMVQTVRNVLNFVNSTQSYDREKVRLLMNGTLSTSDMLDFINDPSESLATNTSFCYERALLATTILRAARVPTRTFTNDDLKTWVQVWLPQIGWVDGEVLCIQPQLQPLFPRSLSVSVPRMIENSSNAVFPFTWSPRAQMRVANLTLTSLEEFDIKQYQTVLCQPTDLETYATEPESFSFPIIFEPETVQAALTFNNSDLNFHIMKDEENVSKKLTLGVLNSIEFGDITVSFNPVRQNYSMIVLNDFSVRKTQSFDLRLIFPLLIAVPILLIVSLYWKAKRKKPSLNDHGKLISSKKS
ncbi:MAG TPA: transglutaminase-like domain-containing protein [Candidatus Bathyarchaeia archaeon]|nr:transglutaminase-like domain-containing protein [Candidatus Bathyarchaeia archaeon]